VLFLVASCDPACATTSERDVEGRVHAYAMKHKGKGLDDKLEKSETRNQDLDRDISNGRIYVFRLEVSIKGYYECPQDYYDRKISFRSTLNLETTASYMSETAYIRGSI
jgi:hypothetical protein